MGWTQLMERKSEKISLYTQSQQYFYALFMPWNDFTDILSKTRPISVLFCSLYINIDLQVITPVKFWQEDTTLKENFNIFWLEAAGKFSTENIYHFFKCVWHFYVSIKRKIFSSRWWPESCLINVSSCPSVKLSDHQWEPENICRHSKHQTVADNHA